MRQLAPLSTTRRGGWASLFGAAFRDSRNAMGLLDAARAIVDVNGALVGLLGYSRDVLLAKRAGEIVVGGPLFSASRWERLLDGGRFTGEVELIRADSGTVAVQWAATPELVTGARLVLFVALTTSRWGPRFRRDGAERGATVPLSSRELDVLRLIALGRSGPEIAGELGIAHDTVRTHVRNAMGKTGARSRAHLVAKALADGHVAGHAVGSSEADDAGDDRRL